MDLQRRTIGIFQILYIQILGEDFNLGTRDLSTGRSVSNEALDAMRPRLRVSRPPRRLNVERIFCRPF